jgi:MFS family permease
MASIERASLNRNRNFIIFWAGQSLSVLGDAFVLIAVPLLVLQATGSVAMMGLVTAMHGAGSLLAGIFTGAIVDRVDRRRLMIWCDVGRVLLYGMLPFIWRFAGPHLWVIYVITFLGAGLAMLFGVAYITAVANLVDRDQIIDANGRLHATFAVGFVLGPMLAGLITGRFGADVAVGLNGLTFAVSALSLTRIRLRRSAAVQSHADRTTLDRPAGRWAILSGLMVGLRFLFADPLFRALTVLIGTMAFLTTGVLDLFVYHLKENLGQSDSAVGVIFGIASIGAIISGVLASRLRRRFGFGTCVIAGLVTQAVAMAAIGLAPAVGLVVIFASFYTLSESLRGILIMTMRQEVTPDHLLGRVTAAFWMTFNIPGPLGAAAITALGEFAGVRIALGVAAISLLGAVFAARGPIGEAHPEVAAQARIDATFAPPPPASDAPAPAAP